MDIAIYRFTQVTEADDGYTNWTNVSGSVDDTGDTFASVTLSGVWDAENENYWESSEDLRYDDHTVVSGTNYIRKVFIGVKCKSNPAGTLDYTDESNFDYKLIYLGPYLTTPSYYYRTYVVPTTTNTIHWVDITYFYNIVGYGNWDWEDLLNLKCYVYGDIWTTVSGQEFTVYVDDIYLKVYTSNNPPGTYGLECFDSAGNKTLNNNDRISRVIWQKTVESMESGSEEVQLPDGGGTLFSFAQVIDDSGGTPHNVTGTVSGSICTMSWTPCYIYNTTWDFYGIPSTKSLITLVGW